MRIYKILQNYLITTSSIGIVYSWFDLILIRKKKYSTLIDINSAAIFLLNFLLFIDNSKYKKLYYHLLRKDFRANSIRNPGKNFVQNLKIFREIVLNELIFERVQFRAQKRNLFFDLTEHS